jgi:hypothetical protein
MPIDIHTFLGLRGTQDWQPNQRPENWRETILRLELGGSVTLTGLTAAISQKPTDDPKFHWWEKRVDSQLTAVTGVYTNAALTTAYSGSGAAGDALYIKTGADALDSFRIGHVVQLGAEADPFLTCAAYVAGRNKNGANSYLQVSLLEADDNSSTSDLSAADTVWVIGNANSEGSTLPDAIAWDPTPKENVTQIFRTPLNRTRTAARTRLRTGDDVKQARAEAAIMHGVEMEKAFLFGVMSETVGSNGKPQRTTAGVASFILDNRDHFSGTWAATGWEWLSSMMEQVARYNNGSGEWLALCGSQAMLGIQRLAEATGEYRLNSLNGPYGIKVTSLETAFGTWMLKTHPLFSIHPVLRKSILVVTVGDLVYRYVDDTKYLSDRGPNELDGEESEFLTEAGLEVHHQEHHALLTNVGG